MERDLSPLSEDPSNCHSSCGSSGVYQLYRFSARGRQWDGATTYLPLRVYHVERVQADGGTLDVVEQHVGSWSEHTACKRCRVSGYFQIDSQIDGKIDGKTNGFPNLSTDMPIHFQLDHNAAPSPVQLVTRSVPLPMGCLSLFLREEREQTLYRWSIDGVRDHSRDRSARIQTSIT